ncbi:unnamed protein product [Penicillium roqueforti FM164]|uniref:Uncharacterized protein n=1 Tax=Penicillium roqueforti (strain FM164) TaxID=1365484 RepID=W6R9K2_PENRF|nr:unnamed protein product [Penicillium roqueforti FM164]
MTKIDHPTSPSPINRPAKRQCRVSQAPEDRPILETHPQQASNGTTIEPNNLECYVVKSAQKIRLKEEQRQLQASNDLLASDSDILLQLYNEQASVI